MGRIPLNFGTVVANPDYYNIIEDGTLDVPEATGLLLNDYASSGSLTALTFSQPAHGTVSVGENGSFTYTPDQGYVGTESFTYTAGSGLVQQTGTVTIDVFQPLLVATPDTYIVQAGGTLTLTGADGVLSNDLTTGGTIIATNFTNVSHGTVSLGENGGLTYTPNAGYVGTASFTYFISNGYGTASATVTLDVVDGAPVANTDSYTVHAGQTLDVSAAQGVLANDIDPGGTIIATNFTAASHGTASLGENGAFTYTPDAGYVGPDSFTYTISDGAETASATVNINVVDAAPVAAADYYQVAEDGTLTVNAANGVLRNDFDADGDPIIATNFTNVSHGTVSLGENGAFTYTPDTGYVGTDSFTYFISDGSETASATVDLQVGLSGVIANPDTYSVFEGKSLTTTVANGVLANDFASSGSLIATNFTNVSHGTVSLGENGAFTYTPTAAYVGPDTFTYFISNGSGTASATAAVDVIAPTLVATPDLYVMHADGTLTTTAPNGVLANDLTTGGTLIATNFTNVSHGTVSLGENGAFTYTPSTGYVGDDSFTYFISNGFGTASATAKIDVVDDAPIANTDSYTVHAGQTLNVDAVLGVLANDIDPGGTIIATNFTSALHGTVSLGENGAFTYTPDTGYVGIDSFTYYISDGTETASAAVDIDVVDTPPVAYPDFYHIAEDGTLTVSAADGVLLNDFDADGDPIIATNFTNTSHGTVSLGENGAFTYKPNTGYVGTDSFTYFISDGSETASAVATIDVACYCAGTRILTDHGEVPVEALAAGDRVVTLGGAVEPLVWIGRRTVDCRRHPAALGVWPVRIAAGAFGAGLPSRSLFLSPDHSVYVDGVLVPVKYLINESSIVQEVRSTVSYYHIELSRHCIIMAENLPAETLLPGSDRSRFANGGSPATISSDFHALNWEAAGCAPLVVTGPALEAVRWRLAQRALWAEGEAVDTRMPLVA